MKTTSTFFTLAITGFPISVIAGPAYTINAIDPGTTRLETRVTSLGEIGEVTGYSIDYEPRQIIESFVFREGRYEVVSPSLRDAKFRFTDYNSAQNAIGFRETEVSPAGRQAVQFRDGNITDFQSPIAGSYAYAAFGINSKNVAVGEIRGNDGIGKAVKWTNGQPQLLVQPANVSFIANLVINDAGGIGGTVSKNIFEYRPVIWSGDQVLEIPIPTKQGGLADINNNGVAVGELFDENDINLSRGYIYSDGGVRVLPSLPGSEYTRIHAINDGNQIVGNSSRRATLWTDNRVVDLNDLIPQDSGWVLYSADHINNRGQIAGYGAINGVSRSFLLTPAVVPLPPAALSTLTLVPAFLGWARLRKRAANRGN